MTSQPTSLSHERQRREQERVDAALWAIAPPPEEEILACVELTARIALEPNLDTLWNRVAAHPDHPHARRILRVIAVVGEWRARTAEQPRPALHLVPADAAPKE